MKGNLVINSYLVAIQASLCMAVHFQQGIKVQCKQMWTCLEVFICENKFYVFSTVTGLLSFAG